MTLNEWNKMFEEIYSKQNYYHDIYEVQNHLTEVISIFGRSFTKKPFQESKLIQFLPKSIAWYFALVQKLGVHDINHLLWKKYPGCCPYCLEKICKCKSPRAIIDIKKLNQKLKSNARLKPTSFDGWQVMFNSIYNERNLEMEPAALMGKFVEEFGEMNEAIRLHSKDKSNVNWQNELADIFAWLIAGTNYINARLFDRLHNPLKIGSLTYEKYPNKCGRCKHKPCTCAIDLAVERYSEPGPYESTKNKNTVFIVHGRNHEVRDALDLFLKTDLNMNTIVLENEPNSGRIVLHKFLEESSRAFSTVVILTPDDEISGTVKQKMARQNVMFEMGYFIAKLGPKRVILLHHKDVTIPSDLLGLAYVDFEKFNANVKEKIRKEFVRMIKIHK